MNSRLCALPEYVRTEISLPFPNHSIDITKLLILMKNRIAIFFLFSIAVLFARADDFGLWTGVEASQNLGMKGLSAEAGLGFRANNSLKSVDRWSGSLGLNYSPIRHLKFGVGYTYIYAYKQAETKDNYRNRDNTWNGYNYTHPYWRSKNRFNVDVKGDIDAGRFNISLRERYQLTRYNTIHATRDRYRFDQVVDENGATIWELRDGYPEMDSDKKGCKTKDYLRSKLEVSYNIRHCPLTPAVSVELEQNLHDSFHIDEVRYSAGVNYNIIKKKLSLALDYHFCKGNGDDDDDDIHAVELSLKFKNIFFKPKK